MVSYQWGIFWADLNPSKGSEQAGHRPVLVVSSEEANQALPIVTVLSLTSLKPGRKVYPTEAFLSAVETGLAKDSIAMAHQIRAVSKERLGSKCGGITDKAVMERVQAVMMTYLDLT